MGDHIQVVSHALRPPLFSAEAMAHLRALADRLPSCSVGGFECRLGEKSPRVDFHVFLPTGSLRLIDTFRDHPGWQPLRDLAGLCADRASPVGRGVLNFVLEFDVEAPRDEIPAPSVFAALARPPAPGAELATSVVREQLRPTPLARLRQQVDRCLDALVPGAFVNHAGAMTVREPRVVRLNVGGVGPDRVPQCLAAMGWDGDLEHIRSAVARLEPWTDSLDLALDVSETGLMPRLGFECFLHRQPADEPRWQGLLDQLVRLGLCAPDKAQALVRWPGVDRQGTSPGPWPLALVVADRILAERVVSFFVRRINHLKVIVDGGRMREAKAYLLFGHQWMDRRACGRPMTP